MTWWEYVQRIAEGATQAVIAERAGISQSSVARWRTVQPKTENVIAFATAYGRPRGEALRAAGILTEEDVQIAEVPPAVDRMPTGDLVALLHRIGDELGKRTKT